MMVWFREHSAPAFWKFARTFQEFALLVVQWKLLIGQGFLGHELWTTRVMKSKSQGVSVGVTSLQLCRKRLDVSPSLIFVL